MARMKKFLGPMLILALLLATISAIPWVSANGVWSVTMTAATTTEGSNSNLEFGPAVGATDAYDSGIDLPAPPSPPGSVLYAYFFASEEPDPDWQNLYKDFRAPLDLDTHPTIEWTLYTESPSEQITLTWDASALPSDVSLWMTGGGLNTNMRVESSVTLAGGVNHILTIAATKLGASDEVWVDDSWSSQDDVDSYDPTLVWQYDAFNTIQDGIDNVSSSTVHVLAGNYSGFGVTDGSYLSIIGEEEGVEVTGANKIAEEDGGWWAMALVNNSTNINIENIDFDGAAIHQSGISGICYAGSTGSITDVIVRNIVGTGGERPMGMGIEVWGGVIDTVNISDSTVQGCQVGVMVIDDQANLSDCTITGLAGGDVPSYGIIAVDGAIANIESCDISKCWVEEPEPGQAGVGIMVGGVDGEGSTVKVSGCSEIFNNTYGIYVADGGDVEVSGCSKILDNSFGIYVDDGDLVANGNNIAGNDICGIYNNATGEVDAENNWWGDENGPTHEDNPLTTTGDEVVGNVDYIPWLDAPCPGGEPAGPVADFSATPRDGSASLKVKFTDESTSTFAITAWAWDFDNDGTVDSEEQNPSYTYSKAGSYTVSLTVTDELGLSDAETKSAYIHVVKKAAMVAKPAKFVASYLRISPNQVLPGQEVKISLNIANHGEERGSDTVALYINSQLEQSQTVGVSPGCCQDVVFRVTKSTPGTYQVSVKGQQGQFTVLAPAATGFFAGGLGAGGIIAIVVFVIALILGLVLILKRE